MGFMLRSDFNSKRPRKVFHIPKKFQTSNKVIDAVGIDLGTTRCCVAVNRAHGIETVALDNSERLLPSYIAVDERKVKCGQIVIGRLRYHSKSSAFDSKRMIGKKFGEFRIDSSWPFEVICDNEDNPLIKLESYNPTTSIISPMEISAMLLRHVKQKAEEFQGRHLHEVVICIPFTFTLQQEAATLDAAKKAGWKMINFLPEPIAALFPFYIDLPLLIDESETVLLVDLGGGTLQVCVIEIIDDQLQIMSGSCNPNLGGREFDNVLFNHFLNLLISQYGIEEDRINKTNLKKKCQEIKELLSFNNEAHLDVEDFDLLQQGLINITRHDFEHMCTRLLHEIINVIQKALNTIIDDTTAIEKVFHFGGGSKMPMIKQLLQQMFPNAEHIMLTNCDECVALGAAYHAYEIYEKRQF